jgi:predicted acetyltransferase
MNAAVLRNLCTSEQHRRQGIATALIQHLVQMTLGVPIVLTASETGAPLYARLGFRTSSTVLWEKDGVVVKREPVMVRPGHGDIASQGSVDTALVALKRAPQPQQQQQQVDIAPLPLNNVQAMANMPLFVASASVRLAVGYASSD